LPVTIYNLLSRGMLLKPVMVWVLAQACLSYGTTVAAESRQPDAAPVPINWRKLELRDSGMTGSVTTRIEQRTLAAAAVQPALLDAPGTMSAREEGTRIQELVVASSIRSLLGIKIENRTRLWFNVDDGLPLQLMRLRQGRKPSQKLYRFGSSQVYRQRRQPADKTQAGQPAGHWSEISESFYPLPDAEGGGCPIILESAQLLYLLSRPDHVFSERTRELCVFDRQRVYRVGFRLQGRESIDVDYLQVDASQETRVKRTLEALLVALTSRPLDDAEGDVQPFSFLGLNDDIHLLLSEPGRIPLRVRGRVSGFGKIDLKLEKLTR